MSRKFPLSVGSAFIGVTHAVMMAQTVSHEVLVGI